MKMESVPKLKRPLSYEQSNILVNKNKIKFRKKNMWQTKPHKD